MEKLKYKKLEVMQSKIKNKSELPTCEQTCADQSKWSFTVTDSWLIYTVYHLLVKNNKVEERGGGGMGLKERGSLVPFFPWKKGGRIRDGGLFQRGGGLMGDSQWGYAHLN